MHTFATLLFAILVVTNISGRHSTSVPDAALKVLMTIANDLSKTFGLIIGRDDFNSWFIKKQSDGDNLKNEYDFIIVGSGSTGSVIANRLSEIGEWSVLLIEAGRPETALMDVPIGAPAFQYTEYNWGYVAEPQNGDFQGLENGKMNWPRGRALGGSSTLNFMMYTRGNRWDYDRWAADGNPGWSYDEVLPYFLKSERARLDPADYNYHNTDGYLSVEDPYRSELVRAFTEAGPELGLPYIDYNTPNNSMAVSTIQATTRRGKRNSVATAFLWPVRDRPNLDILIEAFVTEILIDPSTKEARGVRFEKNGKITEVYAKKEVILSAGVLNSPQLLMLAGIGPRQHLEQLGIPVLEDLPVGRNLQDHLMFPGLVFLTDENLSITPAKVLAGTPEYILKGTGPLSSLIGVEGIGYVKTSIADYPEEYPDMEFVFFGSIQTIDHGLLIRRTMRITDEVFDSIFRPLIGKGAWTIFPVLLHPKSVGYLELKSTDPKEHPRFFGNYYSDPTGHDIRTMIEGIRAIEKLANATAFQKWNSRLSTLPMYGCQDKIFDSDEYWECCLRSISVTIYHPTGTAKMGPREDPTAVVDPRLRVHGISRLRVADCSVIPDALSAHTNAPAIMIGEKTSDIIKQDWGVI